MKPFAIIGKSSNYQLEDSIALDWAKWNAKRKAMGGRIKGAIKEKYEQGQKDADRAVKIGKWQEKKSRKNWSKRGSIIKKAAKDLKGTFGRDKLPKKFQQ